MTEPANPPLRLIRERLGEKLGILPRNLGRYLDREGAPQADEAGTYDVEAVSVFIKSLGLRSSGSSKLASNLTDWKEKVAAEQFRMLRNKNRLMEKKVISVASLEAEMARYGSAGKEKLYLKLTQEAPARLFLCKSIEEMRVQCREIADEIAASMSGLFDQYKQVEGK